MDAGKEKMGEAHEKMDRQHNREREKFARRYSRQLKCVAHDDTGWPITTRRIYHLQDAE